MKTDQLDRIETIEHEGEQLIVLSERAGGVLSCRDATGHYVELSNRSGKRIVTGRSTRPVFPPQAIHLEELDASDEPDDEVLKRMARMAGVKIN